MNIETKFDLKQKVMVKLSARSKMWDNSDPDFRKDDKNNIGKIKEISVEVGKKTSVQYLVAFDPKDEDWDELYNEKELEAV